MRLLIIDFSSSDAGWGLEELGYLRGAIRQPLDSIDLYSIQAGSASDEADAAMALRLANEAALQALNRLDLPALDSPDLLLVNGADPANLLALQDWFDARPAPRPTLVLRFCRSPLLSWAVPNPLTPDMVSRILGDFGIRQGVSARFAAATAPTAAILSNMKSVLGAVTCLEEPISDHGAADFLATLIPALGQAAQLAVPDQPRVLFFAPFGAWGVHHQLDAVVASAVRLRGGAAHVMTCDGLFQPCVSDRTSWNCQACQHGHKDLFASFETPESRITDWLSRPERDEIERWAQGLPVDELPHARYQDIPAGELVLSNLYTHYRISSLGSARAPEIVTAHRRFLADSVICYLAVRRAILQLGVTSLFLFNGRMYPYRAAMTAAHDLGLKVAVHERGRLENSFGFFQDVNSIDSDYRSAEKAAWADIPLDEAELEALDHLLSLKLKGKGVNWKSYYSGFADLDQNFFDLLDVPRDAKLVGYFTTSPDEICLLPAYGDVSQQFDLINRIADLLKESGHYLIVRHHPAIGGGPNFPPELDGLMMAYRQAAGARDNVRVIMPNDPIPSTALYPYLDAAIALISSVGLELMASGVPTICGPVAEIVPTDMERFPFVMRSLADGELTRVIREVILSGRKIAPDDLRHCLRSVYDLYLRKSVQFRAVSMREIYAHKIEVTDPEVLVPGFDPAIDRLCEVLAGRERLYAHPDAPHRKRSDQAENAYAEACIARFAERDATLAAARASVSARPAPRASDLALLTFGVSNPPLYGTGWRRQSLTGGGDSLKQLEQALHNCAERWVWVGSDRFALHGVFATRLWDKLAAMPDDRAALPLTGWFTLRDQFRPARLGVSALTPDSLRALFALAPGLSDALAGLSLAVWRRDYLVDHLLPALSEGGSAAPLLDALSGLAGSPVEIAEPIFLNA
jgi:hypothetical protein